MPQRPCKQPPSRAISASQCAGLGRPLTAALLRGGYELPSGLVSHHPPVVPSTAAFDLKKSSFLGGTAAPGMAVSPAHVWWHRAHRGRGEGQQHLAQTHLLSAGRLTGSYCRFFHTVTQGQSTKVAKHRSIPTGRATATALVRGHRTPQGWGDKVWFGNVASKAEKGGAQLYPPPEPSSSTSKGHLGISAGNPSFSWENVKVWGGLVAHCSSRVKLKLSRQKWMHLSNSIWIRPEFPPEMQPTLSLPPVKFFSM